MWSTTPGSDYPTSCNRALDLLVASLQATVEALPTGV